MQGISPLNFADTIKSIRRKSLLSQNDFAHALGVSFSTVNRWENGKCKPSLSAMKEIKTFCVDRNLSYDELEEAWFDFDEKSEE